MGWRSFKHWRFPCKTAFWFGGFGEIWLLLIFPLDSDLDCTSGCYPLIPPLLTCSNRCRGELVGELSIR